MDNNEYAKNGISANKFGDNLKKLRVHNNMTQEQLAKYLGLTKTAISCYESGKRTPNHEIEEEIARFFNISLDSLRGRKPIDHPLQSLAPEIQATVYFMQRLSENDRFAVLRYVEYLAEQNTK